MVPAPLFPGAVDAVTRWLDSCGATVSQRHIDDEKGHRCRSWKLSAAFPELDGTSVCLVLLHDFPLRPARIEIDKRFCLKLPHVEADGNLCHGVTAHADDIDHPVEAVQRVLARFGEYLELCRDPGWLEGEFQAERADYWARHAARTKAPSSYGTTELLLDVDVTRARPLLDLPAVSLADGSRALATSSAARPEDLAALRGWPVGTIIRGGAVVVDLPARDRWTPATWPRSFAELDELASQLAGRPRVLSDWFTGPWPNKAPLFVVLMQGAASFGWRIMPAHFGRADGPVLLPITVSRIDRQWSLCRDHDVDSLNRLTTKSVAVLGAGSLGAPVVELLARAGVGALDIVDPQCFEAENISRHSLGAREVGCGKAVALRDKVLRDVPGADVVAYPVAASTWLSSAKRRKPDLIVDCTGEAPVRVLLSELRASGLGSTPVLAGWMEPRCAAAHAVLMTGTTQWPRTDPVETAINIAQWPPGLQVQLPGCGRGFHPYGMADTARVAGLIAERALAVLNGDAPESAVWSLVRSRQYFLSVSSLVTFNCEPPDDGNVESITLYRPWSVVMNAAVS